MESVVVICTAVMTSRKGRPRCPCEIGEPVVDFG